MIPMVQVSEEWLGLAGKAKRMAIIAHISPDGDTLGASLALRLAFLSMGVEVDVICDGDVPASLRFLPGAECFLHPEDAAGGYDTALAADDHHATNPAYGDANFIRRGESACCLLAYEAIEALGVALTREMGICLLTGISTDTGHFQYPSTSPATLMAAGRLLALGVDISLLTRRLYRTQPVNRVHLTRIAYERMRFLFNGQVGVISITRKDFEETGCAFSQVDGLVNHALEVEGVRMAVLASERDSGIKMSLRAVEPDTVDDVALLFGGGGHAQAAGCTIHAPLDEALDQVLAVIARKLEDPA